MPDGVSRGWEHRSQSRGRSSDPERLGTPGSAGQAGRPRTASDGAGRKEGVANAAGRAGELERGCPGSPALFLPSSSSRAPGCAPAHNIPSTPLAALRTPTWRKGSVRVAP